MNFSEIPNPTVTPEPVVAPEAKEVVKPEAGSTVTAPVESKTEEAKAEILKRKYKVNGKEVELTDEESSAWIQKALHADQQIKEATQLKKQTAAMIEKLKTPQGLREILSDPSISLDRKQLAIEWVKEYMEEEAMDPKDRELKTVKEELAEYRAKEDELKAQREQEAKQAEIKQAADAFRNEIVTVMEANKAVLPKSQAVMDRIIGYMRAGYRQTGKVLPAAEAVKYVIKDYNEEVGSLTKESPIERLMEMLGPDVIEKIRKADLAALKAKLDPKASKVEQPDLHKDVKKDKKGRISEKEFRKQIFGGL